MLDLSGSSLNDEHVNSMVDPDDVYQVLNRNACKSKLWIIETLAKLEELNIEQNALKIESVTKIRKKLIVGQLTIDGRPSKILAAVDPTGHNSMRRLVAAGLSNAEASLLAAQYEWVERNRPECNVFPENVSGIPEKSVFSVFWENYYFCEKTYFGK